MKPSRSRILTAFSICLGIALLGGCPSQTPPTNAGGSDDSTTPTDAGSGDTNGSDRTETTTSDDGVIDSSPQKEAISVSVLDNVAVYHILRDRFYEDDKNELAEEASQTVVRAVISRILGVSGWLGIVSGTIFNTLDVGAPTRVTITERIGNITIGRSEDVELLPVVTYDTGTEMLYWNGLTLRTDTFICISDWNTILDAWVPLGGCTDYVEIYATTIDLMSAAEAQSLESEFSWGDFVNVIVPLESVWDQYSDVTIRRTKAEYARRFVLLDGSDREIATGGFEP